MGETTFTKRQCELFLDFFNVFFSVICAKAEKPTKQTNEEKIVETNEPN